MMPTFAPQCEAGPSRAYGRAPLGALDNNISANEHAPRRSPIPRSLSLGAWTPGDNSGLVRSAHGDARFVCGDAHTRSQQVGQTKRGVPSRQEQEQEQEQEDTSAARKRIRCGPGALDGVLARVRRQRANLPPAQRGFPKPTATTHHDALPGSRSLRRFTSPPAPRSTANGDTYSEADSAQSRSTRETRDTLLSPRRVPAPLKAELGRWPLEPFAPFPGSPAAPCSGTNPWGETDRTRAKYSTADYRVLWTVWARVPLPRPIECARLGAFLGKSTDKMTTWFSNRRQDSKRAGESSIKAPQTQIQPHALDSPETAAIDQILSGEMSRERFFLCFPQYPQSNETAPVSASADPVLGSEGQPRSVPRQHDTESKSRSWVSERPVVKQIVPIPTLDEVCRVERAALARRQYQHLLDRLPTEEPSSDPVLPSETEDDEIEDEDGADATETFRGGESPESSATPHTEVSHLSWRTSTSYGSDTDPRRQSASWCSERRLPETPRPHRGLPSLPSLSWTPSSGGMPSPFTPTFYPRPSLTHRESSERTTWLHRLQDDDPCK